MSQRPFLEQLELHDNELDVRENIAKGVYGSESLALAQEWLRRKESGRTAVASAARDSREERMAIAAEAAAVAARAAAKWAMYAAIIATAAMAIAIKDHILVLLFP